MKSNKWIGLLIILMLVALLPPVGGEWTTQAQVPPPGVDRQGEPLANSRATTQDPPGPLPEDCDDVTPAGGNPPACCVHGYVYYNGAPVAGATVTVQSASGSVTVTTENGPDSDYPYYGIDLSDPPLNVGEGDTITVRTVYNGLDRTVSYQVVTGGQQVDGVLAENKGSGIFIDSGQELGNFYSSLVGLGDLDGDGDLDAFVANDGQGNRVWLNDGHGVFTDTGQSLGNLKTYGAALGDVDGDGDLDAFAANGYGAVPNKVWLNDGMGFFVDSGQSLGASDSKYVALGDLDGDGDLDAFIAVWNAGNRVWLNDGTGMFTDTGQSLGEGGPDSWGVALGDVDGDGDLDAFVANGDKANKVWLNDGTGIFHDSGQSLGSSKSLAIALGDLDSDGDLDAFVGNTDGQANKVWLNNGEGMFEDSGQNLGNSHTYDVSLSDVDGDGDIDAFAGNAWSQANKIWLNNGMGIFEDSSQNLGNSHTTDVSLGDVDGDGDPDAFVANDFNQPNKVWLNQNQTFPPIATIHAIAPNPATQGQDTVAFYGSGQDQDEDGASIVAYRWRSDLDGVLSTQAEFTKPAAELSPGTHTIYFQVQDDEGDWSEEVTRTLTINSDGSPVAGINYIWPEPATQGQDTIYFNGNGYDTDEGGAYITAYEWSSDLDGLLSAQEDFTVQASELSAGTHTITFKCQDDEGLWSPSVSRSLTVEAGQADVRTLILVNRQKLESLYGASQAAQVMDKLNALAARDSVQGRVVQVEDNATVAAAYAARGNDYEDKDKANAVAKAIAAQIIAAEWNAHPDLEYLVLVGDDRVIPFYRTYDGTWYPDVWTLTDDFYTDREPTPCSECANPYLYVPDLASGRLVETPSQIVGQIDAFLADDTIDLNDAAVSGYDFIQDGAQAHCQSLQADGLAADCTLIGDYWTKSDFEGTVLQHDHDVVSINGHANEYGFGTPSGEFIWTSDFTDATVDFARAIFYTVGCHSGYNTPSGLDLPEGFAIMRANYVANTGFGWGGGGVILSEELMWDFTKKMVYGAQSTPGSALAQAKQQYYADHPAPGPYDEKITNESTLYGLPMSRISSPASLAKRFNAAGAETNTSISVQSVETDLGGGLSMDSKFLSWPMPVPQSTSQGTYYTLFGAVTGDHGEPILPRLSYDVGQPDRTLHGVIFTGGSYSNVTAEPVIQSVVTMSVSAPAPAPSFQAPGWYPSVFFQPNRVELEHGTKEMLVAAVGQYNPALSTGQQRIYTGMSFDLYYHTDSDDWDAPTITGMSSSLGTSASITVRASDPSGIQAVVIAYTDGNSTWHSVSLTENSRTWSGSFPASGSTVFFVQAVDKAGNVTVEDNHGRYFQPGDHLSFDVYLPLVARSR